MSTMTYARPAANAAKGLTFARVLKSELIKFRSLRSTWITYAVALLVADGLGALVSGLRGNEIHNRILTHVRTEPFDAVGFTLHGVMLAQLAIGVVGVLFITGEYATGSIRSSITAVPKRTSVLAAKALVFGVITFVVSLVLTSVAFFVGQAILSSWNLQVTLSHPGAVRAVVGCAFYLTCVGLMGLGFGFAMRSTGGAIATLFGTVLVLPLIAQALPTSWQDHITKFLPLPIAEKMMSTVPGGVHSLSNAWGAGMLAIYAVAALALGLAMLKRRDV